MSDISGNEETNENELNLTPTIENINSSLNELSLESEQHENTLNGSITSEHSNNTAVLHKDDNVETISFHSNNTQEINKLEERSELSSIHSDNEQYAENNPNSHHQTSHTSIIDEHRHLFSDLENKHPVPVEYHKIIQSLVTKNIDKAIAIREEYLRTQEEKDAREHNERGGFPMEFDIFKYEFLATRRNNSHVLDESKQCKRFLDLKYNDLVNIINRIQTSVIFTSTISGFMQATKTQFNFGEQAISIVSITIATYISLVLSISKYYALDELKERIQLLREKYSLLLNEIDYNMDRLGPWTYRKQWLKSDSKAKMKEWQKDYQNISERYSTIISTKKELTSEYEDIMDTKSRNYYDIQNKKLSIENKQKVYKWTHKEEELERTIAVDRKKMLKDVEYNKLDMKKGSIVLETEENDNWSFSGWTDVV